MNVRLETEIDPAVWDGLLTGNSNATYFHTSSFIGSLCALYGRFEARYLVARDDAGRLLGGLPVVEVRRAGMKQVLSLPFGSLAGPVSAGPLSAGPVGPDAAEDIRRPLLRTWLHEATRPGVVRAHLIDFPGAHHSGTPDPDLPATWRVPERTHLISLKEGFSDIWNNRYDKENRTASRKAERLGVTVAIEPGPSAAETLDTLYRSQSVEWTDHAPYEYGLFHRLIETDPERVRIFVARRNGEAVFATMMFYFGATATPWVSGSTREARALCAGNLIHKVMIEDAVKRGFSVYNFGGSGGVAGIEAFKVAFGAVPFDYYSYFSEAPWFGVIRNARRRFLGTLRGSR